MSSTDYLNSAPSREWVDSQPGPLLLEFGTPWCGHCQAAQPLLEAALQASGALPHVKVEDGKGRRLGRSFQVKLWPTLIFLRDGVEHSRLVRPASREAIEQALREIA